MTLPVVKATVHHTQMQTPTRPRTIRLKQTQRRTSTPRRQAHGLRPAPMTALTGTQKMANKTSTTRALLNQTHKPGQAPAKDKIRTPVLKQQTPMAVTSCHEEIGVGPQSSV